MTTIVGIWFIYHIDSYSLSEGIWWFVVDLPIKNGDFLNVSWISMLSEELAAAQRISER